MPTATTSNDSVADLFDELVYWYTVSGTVDSYKISTYRNAAFAIRNADFEVCAASPTQIKKLRGIGDQLSYQIIQICQKSTFPELEKLMSSIPESLLELSSINGLGPKKLHSLWRDMNVKSIDELEQVIDDGVLIQMKGFGKKTVENLKSEIQKYRKNKDFFFYADVEDLAQEVLDYFQSLYPDHQFELVGDILRRSNVLDRVELLSDLSPEDVKEEISLLDKLAQIEEDAAVLYFEQRRVCVLFREEEKWDACRMEKNFTNAGIQYAPDTPVVQTEEYYHDLRPQTENWVRDEDIHGLIHCHSSYSDGQNSIADLAQACIQRGLEYMVLSDHSQSAFYADGLRPERIRKQQEEIAALNAQWDNFRIFSSVECDILSDGSLDYEDEILDGFDVLIASVHSQLNMDVDTATQRLLKAIHTGRIDILGHWTGRLLLRREGYPLHVEKIVKACAEHRVAIEINANPRRLDVDHYYLPYILEQGVKVSINPDAHRIEGIDDLHWGVVSAQKGGLRKEDNISSMRREEFEKYYALV